MINLETPKSHEKYQNTPDLPHEYTADKTVISSEYEKDQGLFRTEYEISSNSRLSNHLLFLLHAPDITF